jgi:hypothetical protein
VRHFPEVDKWFSHERGNHALGVVSQVAHCLQMAFWGFDEILEQNFLQILPEKRWCTQFFAVSGYLSFANQMSVLVFPETVNKRFGIRQEIKLPYIS